MTTMLTHADVLGRARRAGGASRPVRIRPCQALGPGFDHLQPQQAHHQGRAPSLAQHGEHLQGDDGDRLRPVGAVRRPPSPRGRAGAHHPGDRPCPGGRQRLFRRCRLPGGRGLGRGGLPGPGRPEPPMRSRSWATAWSRSIATATSWWCRRRRASGGGTAWWRAPARARCWRNGSHGWPRGRVDLRSFNPDHEDRSMARSELDWIARIVWASQ